MWRVRLDDEPDVVVRLPRRPHAAEGVARELVILQQLPETSFGNLVTTPLVRHIGEPHEVFPHRWSVLEWIDGVDAWTSRDGLRAAGLESLSGELAAAAIIDWGGAGWGDLAQDLAPAWAVLTASERPAFREVMGVDQPAWIRGRTFELEHAIGGVLYYVPRGHPLGDVMARTLSRILANP